MQAFEGSDGVALQDNSAAHGFHTEHGDALLYKFGHDIVREASEVRVHRIQRHLARIEVKIV